MNKRLENKINRKYPSKDEDGRVGNMVWLAKHWYRYITYGCPDCYHPTGNCGCNSSINEPKGFAELAEYCYNDNEYGKQWRNKT